LRSLGRDRRPWFHQSEFDHSTPLNQARQGLGLSDTLF
jgi:hypothetical protein